MKNRFETTPGFQYPTLTVLFHADVKTPLIPYVWDKPDRAEQTTAKHPFNARLGSSEDIAPVAVFLASDDARWVTGTGVSVDGGYVCQ